MQPVALCGRFLNQIAVAESERVGVHHDAADFIAVMAQCGEVTGVTLQARGAIFHQHHDTRQAGESIKAALFK
ncbi:hypothetical protein D3C75_1216170 [compost metagenome]